jgi:hypothetical protein
MAYFILLVALSISAVAAYYSIVGLVTIFAAAVIPVAIMGSVLEVGKLATTVWLHRYWDKATWWLKSYLTLSVLVLMLITSMGIFGFLSKAHIEQTAQADQSEAVIERIDDQIIQITRRIEELQSAGSVNNEKQNAQIENNTLQIEQINTRYDGLVDEQNQFIADARRNLDLLEQYIANNDVESLQALVGAKVDGRYGSGTARRVEEFRNAETTSSERIVSDARQEIRRLRNLQSEEVSAITEANRRLQAEIGTVTVDTVQIEKLNSQLNELRDKKFELETEFRKLEAEFGPVKYIAELIYGSGADTTQLDEAVRIVILLLIFVFDPLAVLLLIASQHTIMLSKKEEQDGMDATEITGAADNGGDTPEGMALGDEPLEFEAFDSDEEVEGYEFEETYTEPKKKKFKLSVGKGFHEVDTPKGIRK